MVAAIAAFILFASTCKEKTPGGFFSAGQEEISWGAVWIGTAVVAFIAYLVGKNSK